MSIAGSKKDSSKRKKKQSGRGRKYGVPRFDKDGKLKSWVKKKLR